MLAIRCCARFASSDSESNATNIALKAMQEAKVDVVIGCCYFAAGAMIISELEALDFSPKVRWPGLMRAWFWFRIPVPSTYTCIH